MSRCAPLLFRSTSPGLGVVSTSSMSARVQSSETRAASTEKSASVRIFRTALWSSGTLWRRREAQSRPGLPQTRQRRGRLRSSFFPSGVSTSRSNSRPSASRSSIARQSALSAFASASTHTNSSGPVGASFGSRCRTGMPASSSAASSRAQPSK